MKVYALTQSYLEFCSCKVAKLKSEGKLYTNEFGVYFYSEVPKKIEHLEDDYYANNLIRLTAGNNIAVELGIATLHKRVLSISKMPYDCVRDDLENQEFDVY